MQPLAEAATPAFPGGDQVDDEQRLANQRECYQGARHHQRDGIRPVSELHLHAEHAECEHQWQEGDHDPRQRRRGRLPSSSHRTPGIRALGYPFGDVVIVLFVVLAVRGMTREGRLPLWLLLGGLLAMALADSTYA